MPTLDLELYEAQKEAKVSAAIAKPAVTAIAEGSHTIARVEGDISTLKGDVSTLKIDMELVRRELHLMKSMIGFNLAATMAILWKLMK
jgi:hypothetical protein